MWPRDPEPWWGRARSQLGTPGSEIHFAVVDYGNPQIMRGSKAFPRSHSSHPRDETVTGKRCARIEQREHSRVQETCQPERWSVVKMAVDVWQWELVCWFGNRRVWREAILQSISIKIHAIPIHRKLIDQDEKRLHAFTHLWYSVEISDEHPHQSMERSRASNLLGRYGWL